MSKFFKNFKKVSSDGKSTTFKHEDGHEIKIAHSKLSKEMRKDIEKLPHYDAGGYVADNSMSTPGNPQPQNYDPSAQGDRQLASVTNGLPGSIPGSVGTPDQVDPAMVPQQAGPKSEEAKATLAGPTDVPQAQQPGMMSDYAKTALGGLGEQIGAIKGLGAVQEKGAAEQAQTAHLAQLGTQENQSSYAESRAPLNEERQNRIDDLRNGYIKPNHYFENQSTGSKIATAIGLALGGMGSGLTGGPNLAYDFMIKQRDADIAAQQKNLGVKENLLSHIYDDYKNINDATNVGRIFVNDLMAEQTAEQVARTQSQSAKLNGQNLIGQLHQNSAMLQSMLHQGGGQDMSSQIQLMRASGNPAMKEMADSLEKRYVPGEGVAEVPVDQKDRDALTARKDLDQSLVKLRTFAQQHAGSLNPAEINYGNSLASNALDKYRTANGQGVFREAEKNFVEGVISDNPTAFFNKFRTDPKYQAAIESNRSSMNELRGKYKFKGGQQQQSQPGQINFTPRK